jgi:hypothetical protein
MTTNKVTAIVPDRKEVLAVDAEGRSKTFSYDKLLIGTEVSKRIDTVAAAIHNGMTMESLNDIDLSYILPLSSPWDPVQMAAQAWSQANRRDTGAES